MDDDLDVKRVLERKKLICEEIWKYDAEKLEAENKSKLNLIAMSRNLTDIHNYTSSDTQFGESNRLKQIINHWNNEIIKPLLLRHRSIT